MTAPIDDALHRRDLAPGRHDLDSGYGSGRHVLDAASLYGIALVAPLLADASGQARAGDGYDRTAFAIDYDARTVTCPQGKTSLAGHRARQQGNDVIVGRFGITAGASLPGQRAAHHRPRERQAAERLAPRPSTKLQAAARAGQQGEDVAGRLQAPRRHRGCRAARLSPPRGAAGPVTAALRKTRLEHAYVAVALNLCRLDAYWNGSAPMVSDQPPRAPRTQPRRISE